MCAETSNRRIFFGLSIFFKFISLYFHFDKTAEESLKSIVNIGAVSSGYQEKNYLLY